MGKNTRGPGATPLLGEGWERNTGARPPCTDVEVHFEGCNFDEFVKGPALSFIWGMPAMGQRAITSWRPSPAEKHTPEYLAARRARMIANDSEPVVISAGFTVEMADGDRFDIPEHSMPRHLFEVWRSQCACSKDQKARDTWTLMVLNMPEGERARLGL